MILGQSIYKLAICFALYFAGDAILGLSRDSEEEMLQLTTIIFNTFVWMQIFNEFNCRRLDNKFNIFENIHKNRWFFVINFLMVGGQILIIFVGGAAFGVTRLNGRQWGICLGFAVVAIPWAAIMKFFPDYYVGVMIDATGKACKVVWVPFGKVWNRLKRLKRSKVRVEDEEASGDQT